MSAQTKPMTEQAIVNEMMIERLEAQGFKVEYPQPVDNGELFASRVMTMELCGMEKLISGFVIPNQYIVSGPMPYYDEQSENTEIDHTCAMTPERLYIYALHLLMTERADRLHVRVKGTDIELAMRVTENSLELLDGDKHYAYVSFFGDK